MRIFEIFWVICYLGFLVLTLVGIYTSLLWFHQLEKAYPEVFDLSGHLASKSQRLTKYWGYMLARKYHGLDDPRFRAKCEFLRIFFWVYLLDTAISLIGIFIVWPASGL